MRLHTLVGFGLMVGAAAGGCQAHTGASQAQSDDVRSDDDDQQPAAEVMDRLRHHHRGGLTQFIAMSLDSLGPEDAKRPQIETIQNELRECMAPVRDIERVLLETLADGVARGTVATVEAYDVIGHLSGTANAMHECKPDALNRLHAVLSPTEREALGDKVQASREVWQQVNEEVEEAGSNPKGGQMAELTQELSLTPGQVDQISAAVERARAGSNTFDAQASESRLKVFATAFASESFDAKKVTFEARGRLVTQGAWRMVRFYQAVAPLLTPAQRAQVAEHLREHSTHQAVISAK